MTPASSRAGFAGSRPVADAPVDALVARAEELARRWASALVDARPLAEIAAVPLERLAREGPALCAQLGRALSSDAELERLLTPVADRGRSTPDRSGLAACLASDRDAGSAVRDVEVLRGVVWQAALGELDDPRAAQVADLSDRLASVCAALLAVALEQKGLAGADAPETRSVAVGRERVLYSSPQTSPGARRAVLIDEHDEPARAPVRTREAPVGDHVATPSYEGARQPGKTATERTETGRPAPTGPRARPWDTPLAVDRNASGLHDRTPQRDVPDVGEVEMRVTRGPSAPVDGRA